MGFLLYFGEDEIPIYKQGLDLFLHHHLSPVGGSVISPETGKSLPGALQSILSGLPMFLSRGLPPGPVVFMAAWNTLAVYLIYVWLRRLYPRSNPQFMAGWVMLSPWSIAFTQLWNASYLPVFSALFFISLLKMEERPNSFWGACGASAAIFFCLQFHLSCVLLAGLLSLEILRNWRKISWSGLVIGSLGASITLLPTFFVAESTSASLSVQVSNVGLRLEHLPNALGLVLRFLTFTTAELSRFVTLPGNGFVGGWMLVFQHPGLFPFFVVAEAGSLFLLVISIGSLARMVTQWKWRPKNLQEYSASLTLNALLMMILSFCFSIRGPAAHAIWILFPLAFVPAAEVLSHKKITLGAVVYQICALIFLVVGYQYVPTDHPSVWNTYRSAVEHYPSPPSEWSTSPYLSAAVSVLYSALSGK